MKTRLVFPSTLRGSSKGGSRRCRFLPLLTSATPAVALALMLVLPTAEADTIGYWRFEEGTPPNPATAPNSVLDSSGHGLHATPVDGPLYSSSLPPGAAIVGSTRSMQFNGSSQRLVVPDSPILQLTQSLTIEAFLKPEPLLPGTANVGQILFRGDNRPGLDPYCLAFEGSGNLLVFQIQDAADNVARVQASVPFDQWLFVAGTLDDATGQMKLFLNGQLVDSTTTSVRPLGALDPVWSPGLSIACDPTGQYGEYFNGWLDEIRLSNVALTPSQFLVPAPEPSTSLLFALAAGAWRMSRCTRRAR